MSYWTVGVTGFGAETSAKISFAILACASLGADAGFHKRRFHVRSQERSKPIGLGSRSVWIRKNPSPGWLYGASSFHFQSMFASTLVRQSSKEN